MRNNLTFIASFLTLSLSAPLFASAQAYVPTIDQVLKTEFPAYRAEFNAIMRTNSDSMSNLIGGNNPSGGIVGACQTQTIQDATQTTDGIWFQPSTGDAILGPGAQYQNPVDASGSFDPDFTLEAALYFLPEDGTLPDPVINQSQSLRCLLLELIDWKKLEINITTHALVKEYYADAANYFLTKQLTNALAAATIEWSKWGIEQQIGVDSGGNPITVQQSAYVGDREANELIHTGKERTGLLLQIQGTDPNVTDLQICDPFKGDTYANLAINSQEEIISQKDLFPTQTECSLDTSFGSVAEVSNFYSNFNTTSLTESPWAAYQNAMDEQNNPLGLAGMTQRQLKQEARYAEADQESHIQASGGFLPVMNNTSQDPSGRDQVVVTPGALLNTNLTQSSQTGVGALSSADEVTEFPTQNAQSLSMDSMLNGNIHDYDINQLLINDRSLADLYREFDYVISDYYNVKPGYINWERSALANTFDNLMYGGGTDTDFEEMTAVINTIINDAATMSPY